MSGYAENYFGSDYQVGRLTFEQIREIQFRNFYERCYQTTLVPHSQSTTSSYSTSDSYSDLSSTQDTVMTVVTPPIDSPWIERRVSTEKYQATRGTPLTLTSLESSQSEFNIARNILDDFSQLSSFSHSETTQVDLGPCEPTYSMYKLGLERKFIKKSNKVKKRRYPVRTKTSPVKWWLGERTVYDENGLLIGKDIRR